MRNFILIAVLIIAIFVIGLISRNWNGWEAIAALSTLIASMGIIFVIYQFSLQKKGHSLDQIKFFLELRTNFIDYKKKYAEAWSIFRKYSKYSTAKEMPSIVFYDITDALTKIYESILFLNQIAQLSKKNLIDNELLYLFYYEQITDHPYARFEFLISWCGTGLDYAAGYDSYDLGRLVNPISELIFQLNTYHENYGGKEYLHITENFEKIKKEFIPNMSKYDVTSNDYVDKYVSIID